MGDYWWVPLLLLSNAIVVLIISLLVANRKIRRHTSRLNQVIRTLREQETQLSLIYNHAREFLGLIAIENDRFIVRNLPDWFIHQITTEQLKARDIPGMELSEFFLNAMKIPVEEAEFLMSKVRLAAESGKRIHFEGKNYLVKSGIADSLMIPVRTEGTLSHILYVSRDITREREWQRDLRQNEEKMRLAVQNVPVMIDAFDQKGRLVVWNQRCEEITGYTAEEMTSCENPFELLYPDPKYRMEVDRMYRGSRNSFNEETTITCKDGSKKIIKWVHRADKFPIPGWSDWGVGLDVTKRRKAENALREREQQLSSMMHNLPGMAWRLKIDKDFTVLFVSQGSHDLLGLDADEVLRKNILPKDLILPEYHELVKQETMKSVSQMQSGELVIPIRSADDKVKWVYDRFKPTRLSNNEVVMDGLLIDISESLENEQRLQLAIEGAREGMWDWNIQEDRIELNQYAAEMLGLDERTVEKASEIFFERIHPADAEDTREGFLSHFKGNTNYVEREYRLRSSGGEWKWILTRGRVMERDKTGHAIRAIGTNIDINDRKLTEIALKKSESHMVNLMANLPGMVYQCKNDKNWTMRMTSQGSLDLTGYSPEEFLTGKVILGEIIHPSDREKVWEQVQEAIKSNSTFTLTYRIITRDGTQKWVWERGTQMPDGGLLEGFITDITDRVRSEERVMNAVINTENAERERIAKELHDNLGQKLTTASLNLHALRGSNLKEKSLKQLENGLDCLEAAIRDSRNIAHNLMPRNIEKFGLVPAIESMLAEIESASELKFEFYNNLNSHRLQKILEVNIYRIIQESINNIIRHSRAGNVSIQIMKYSDDLILTIEDDGTGFDVGAVRANGKSFGLDSMMNRIDSLKGTMNIESSARDGTMLTFEIPLDHENEDSTS